MFHVRRWLGACAAVVVAMASLVIVSGQARAQTPAALVLTSFCTPSQDFATLVGSAECNPAAGRYTVTWRAPAGAGRAAPDGRSAIATSVGRGDDAPL